MALFHWEAEDVLLIVIANVIVLLFDFFETV